MELKTNWLQKEIILTPRPRGFHLVTDELVNQFEEIKRVTVGQVQFFLQHTSASLTINENADPTVRGDFERYFNQSVPENAPFFEHTYEGPDDMPAHLKASLLGCSVVLPVTRGKLNLGTWQGIYLGEHRNHGGSRRVLATLHGQW